MKPLRREDSATEIANTGTCLTSSETLLITATTIDVNGGLAFS
jgi:hypothetical protein